MWSAATLERGRLVALAGDCAVCHTAPGGATNAGERARYAVRHDLHDEPHARSGHRHRHVVVSGVRARDARSISRDGTHLYPAFPYTAFAKLSEPDLLALYAYLMSQPPVKHVPPTTKLPFPLDQRRLVAGWNWLFHDARPFAPDPARSATWNRGKYLVDGAGHCGACHTPRNALGAEKGGLAYLSGGEAEGWVAPPLVASPASPVPWTEGALFDYLRTGFSAQHGVAAGPMAPVVAGPRRCPRPTSRRSRTISRRCRRPSTQRPPPTRPPGRRAARKPSRRSASRTAAVRSTPRVRSVMRNRAASGISAYAR